jgi:hypothetical protein
MSEFKNTKIYFTTPLECEQAQQALFTLGHYWADHTPGEQRQFLSEDKNNIIYKQGYIYSDENCKMTYSSEKFHDSDTCNSYKNLTSYSLGFLLTCAKAFKEKKKTDYKAHKAAKRLARFAGCYFVVENKEESDMVQRALFTLGLEWGFGKQEKTFYNENYPIAISVNRDGSLSFSNNAIKPVWNTEYKQAFQIALFEAAGMLPKKVKKSKADKDGWIEWNATEGSECPVPPDTLVQVYLNGNLYTDTSYRAEDFHWCSFDFENREQEITSYRIVEEQPMQNNSLTIDEMVDKMIEDGDAVHKENFTPFVAEEYLGTPEESNAYEEALNVMPVNPKTAFGQAKLPLHLWSPLATAYGSLGMLNGGKYGYGNFKATPVPASIYIAAIQRHFSAWMEGQEYDPADGVPHLGAVLANVAILLEARSVGSLIDDRQISGGYNQESEALSKIAQSVQKLHADKTPRHYTIKDNKEYNG